MQTMIETDIRIVEFNDCYQNGVERLVLPIQQIEFAVKISREEQPDLMDIKTVFQGGGGNFWVAVDDDNQVVGCAGVVDMGDGNMALKKMFVKAEWRGKNIGLAAKLMESAKRWCKSKGVKAIFLGTTSQMTAAHRFYEKNGFREQLKEELPASFPLVHVDTKFYKCTL